jgi:Fe2+ or Zn2+ uptake regulation protein
LSLSIIKRVTEPNPIVAALDLAGYRLTGPRRVVASLITEHGGHFTALDLENAARDRRLGISRATLFRALDLLTELGLVERVDLPSGEHAYVPCARAHHHHVICSRCGRTADVEDSGVAEAVSEIARRSGYQIESHRLELFGLCRHCQAKPTPDA